MEEILRLVNDNKVVSITAPTGSGKTTKVPETFVRNGYRVVVCVATKASAYSLYEYEKDIIENTAYGTSDGTNYDNTTKLLYATQGYVKNLLLTNSLDTDILFLDEVHNQTRDLSMIISLWKETDIKLVTASSVQVDLGLNAKQFIMTRPNTFKVNIQYLDESQDTYNYKNVAKDLVNMILNDNTEGNIIVFLPTIRDLREMYKMNINVMKLMIHGSSPLSDLKKMFLDTRKVIFATNAIESTVTIPNVKYIVDSMLERRLTSLPSGSEALRTQFISKISADQRAGRTGRTSDGYVFRIIKRSQYEDLSDDIIRDMDTLPPFNPILEFISYGKTPSLLDLDDEEISLDTLTDLGAIKGGEVTDRGKFIMKMPLSVYNSSFLYDWIMKEYNIHQGVLISITIDCYGPSYFIFPLNDNHEKYQRGSVFETLLEMFIQISKYTQMSPKLLKSYCRDNSLEYDKVNEAVIKYRQVVRLLEMYNDIKSRDEDDYDGDRRSNWYKVLDNHIPVNNNFNMDIVKEVLMSTYVDNIMIRDGDEYVLDDVMYRLSEMECYEDRRNKYDKVVALILVELPDGGRMVPMSFGV